MDVKQAVSKAFQEVQDLFANEQLSNLGLEEVEYDHIKQEWLVTVGFSRPWDFTKPSGGLVTSPSQPKRDYKVVRVSESGEVTSVKNREVKDYASSRA